VLSTITDLEQAGLRTAEARPRGRSLLVTVDFEAYRPSDVPRWHAAMHAWAQEASRVGLRSVFFVSVEHVLRLRAADERAHERLIDGLRALTDAGAELQPHNHCAFHPVSGAPVDASELAPAVPGYRKRPSMFFDVVRRNGIPIGDWIPQVLDALAAIRAAVRHPPAPLAFRPGGWDSGGTTAELTAYVAALRACDVRFDSSATRGAYGTRSWHVGMPFGRNTFVLQGSVLEVGATMGWDCGAPGLSKPNLAGALRLLAQPAAYLPPRGPGVLSPVLHFNNLIGAGESAGDAERRAGAAVRLLARLAGALHLTPATFATLGFASSPG
jgi:hypothetical protein